MEVWKPARCKTVKIHRNEHTPGMDDPRRENPGSATCCDIGQTHIGKDVKMTYSPE